MKIRQLKGCPDWLKNAKTENADVEWGSGVGSWIIWNDGVWRGGAWLCGIWRGGSSSCRSAYKPFTNQYGEITVGCKTKTAKDWAEWLKGKEKYKTQRGTDEFAMIRAHILATITYQKELEAYRKKHNITKEQK